MISVRDFHSPDSTVTSLLATSGHLRSSFFPNPAASISYGDRQYESATAALDAYISDFERSRHDPETSTGQLTLQSTPVQRRNMVRNRNRDVLQEQLTDSELDFLTLPLNSQRFSSRHSATDRLTLTTDEMLAIPCDGSLPVTRTSAFLCQPGTYAQGSSGGHAHLEGQNSWLSARSDPRLGSGTTAACVRHSTPTLPPRALRPRGVSQRLEPSVRVPQPQHHHHHLPSQSTETHLVTDATDAAGHQQYPRWLTSQKSEMDFSGITSVPDLKYPAWLRQCDVGSEATPSDPSHQPQGGTHTLPPSPRPPSWLGQLEASCVEQQHGKGGEGRPEEEEEVERGVVSDFLLRDRDAQYNTLRDLRMQFAERLALAEDEERNTDIGNRFREDNIESLIQKAEKALNTPSLGLMEPLQTGGGSPTCTEDLLEAERSWDNPPITFKSPVPVGGAVDEEMFKDRPFQATGSCSPGSSSRKHPGPVEALKQMLFSLQAVEHEVTLGQRSPPLERAEPLHPDSTPQIETDCYAVREIHAAFEFQKDEAEFEDFDTAPGGQSLKRALHHLGRLKSLVEEPRNQREKQVQPERD